MPLPVIGITVDNCDNSTSSGKYESSIAYSRSVSHAGGVPVLLPHEPPLVRRFLQLCQGLVLTGGVDPRTEAFGHATHPETRPMDPRRQAFELALLAAADATPAKPVLGVCLGMQLMALHRRGRLDQFLPDTLENAQIHQSNRRHPVVCVVDDSVLWAEARHGGQGTGIAGRGSKVETNAHGGDRGMATCGQDAVPLSNSNWTVVSHHQQAVADPGDLRTVAGAPDGVIEAVDDPNRPFYLGVQWHPERGSLADPPSINQGLFDRLVLAAAHATSG